MDIMHLVDCGPSGQTIHVAPDTSEDGETDTSSGSVDALPIAISEPSTPRPNHIYKSQFGGTKALILNRLGAYRTHLASSPSAELKNRHSRGQEALRLPLNETDPAVSALRRCITAHLERKEKQPEIQVPDFTGPTLPFSAPEKGRLSAHDEQIRSGRLASLNAVPGNRELFGFYGGEASSWARTEYFASKDRADLLDVLSFCDQLRPQLLADVLVSVSRRHPDLPIFDSPGWSGGAASSSTKARHGHIMLNPKARRRHRNAKKALRRMIFARAENEPPVHVEEVDDDPVPPTWPKAGDGLYAKLASETDDRAYLMDDADGESFSQFMVDKLGKPMIACV